MEEHHTATCLRLLSISHMLFPEQLRDDVMQQDFHLWTLVPSTQQEIPPEFQILPVASQSEKNLPQAQLCSLAEIVSLYLFM